MRRYYRYIIANTLRYAIVIYYILYQAIYNKIEQKSGVRRNIAIKIAIYTIE